MQLCFHSQKIDRKIKRRFLPLTLRETSYYEYCSNLIFTSIQTQDFPKRIISFKKITQADKSTLHLINNHNEILWFKGTDCMMFFVNISKVCAYLNFEVHNNV
jgi:hypothetical protein